MQRIQIFSGFLLATTSLFAAISSAMAHPSIEDVQRIENALYPGSDFFEAGIEQFERQIEQLQTPKPKSPTLTIEASVLFDLDTQEIPPEIQEPYFEEPAYPVD